MAKATKTTAPKVQPAPPLPVAAPIAAPLAPPAAPEVPIPGVINPQADPTTNQPESPTPSSEMPTGPLPPNATTVAPPEADGNKNDGGKKTTKSKLVTAQQAVDEADGDREKAMKAHPHLFAETAKN